MFGRREDPQARAVPQVAHADRRRRLCRVGEGGLGYHPEGSVAHRPQCVQAQRTQAETRHQDSRRTRGVRRRRRARPFLYEPGGQKPDARHRRKDSLYQGELACRLRNDGPRGVAVDSLRNFVFVACTASVQILDGGHGGSLLGKLDTGAGVDNIDYIESTRMLYVAAARAARLTVARIDDKGQPSIVATAATAEGARNAVADANGNAYLADPLGARLLVFTAPPSL